MVRVGFFGGCFNPPTNIHINLANNLIKEGKLDKVVFVPVNDYYKKEDLIEANHRYNMLKLATKDYDNLDVDDIEIKENRKLFAVDAFELICNTKLTNKKEIFFIMGSDNFNKMSSWKDYEKIKDKYRYIVIERDGNEVSSTQTRDIIRNNNEEAKKYLDDEVYKYIIENDLYKL